MEDASKSGETIEVFFSYSHKDEKMRDKLEKHLSILRRENVIAGWHDRKIMPGTEWKGQIDTQLEQSQIILLLVSAEFLHSDYCYDVELKRAIARHEAGDAHVIPIILRPCDWMKSPIGKLQALPRDGSKPVSDYATQDHAFSEVARGIRRVVEEMSRASQAGRGSPGGLEKQDQDKSPVANPDATSQVSGAQISKARMFVPALSNKAQELLLNAAKDQHGLILMTLDTGGFHVQTNGRQFAEPKNARSEAQWKAAVEELLGHGFVALMGMSGASYQLTAKGYEAADLLA